MLLQTVRDADRDVRVGWWMSEKYDGVRAVWTSRELRTRTGNVIDAPDWFLRRFPSGHGLDGELWLGYGRFDDVNTMFRSRDDPQWHHVQFMVFDLLDPASIKEPYKERYRLLQKIDVRPPLVLVRQQPIDSVQHARHYIDLVVLRGGEGVVVRDPDAPYAIGKRSPAVKKWKLEKHGTGTVVGHVPGRGKLAGCVGSLVIEPTTGATKRFYLANPDGCRGHKAIGAKVSYKYMELTKNGVPRHPVFIGANDGAIRKDK